MGSSCRFDEIEQTIAYNKRLFFTFCSFLLALVIYINLSFFQWPVIGIIASIPYFLINGIFFGYALFEKEDAFLRFMLGVLVLVMLLGFVGWLAVILYNLDVIRFTLVLLIVTTISSLLNKRKKKNDV